ncbi:hypothetical protein GCM10023175_53450 [Pseudonocardia xishanensis]|uniref:Uncharacterized protein n=2 Tax=Pseudonocardiaceae TaxID=2070 RepID=A0ABP8S109_9PSEU
MRVMAGRRRTNNAGAELPTTLRKARPTTRRARLMTRFAAATSDVERLTAASDYLRGAAARRHPEPDQAEEILQTVTRQMIDAGDALLTLQARERLHPTTRSRR